MTISQSVWNDLEQDLRSKTGEKAAISEKTTLSGGDINQAFRIQFGGQNYFCKFNSHIPHDFFLVEARALDMMLLVNKIHCPKPITVGTSGRFHYLVLQYIPLQSTGNIECLGRQLAQFHKASINHNPVKGYYGFDGNNYIGTTPQQNKPTVNWCDFWIEQRIKPQLRIAKSSGYTRQLVKNSSALYRGIHDILVVHQPVSVMVHGDLWSGNKSFDENGDPVIYDPALYFGDREVDLALSELFGGFGRGFYRSYDECWALPPGQPQRKDLYNLYHLLNHLNLFGAAYLEGCRRIIDALSRH